MAPPKKVTRTTEVTTDDEPRPTTEMEETPSTEEITDQDDLRARLAAALATIQRLEALATRTVTPASTVSYEPRRSMKLPDPEPLTDGKEPSFEGWRLSIRSKLDVNADHFLSEEARKAYVYSRTAGDAQKHLQPRYDEECADPFLSASEMVAHLAAIYDDPYRVQNARFDYRGLNMKPSQTFAEFYTRFLHLAGRARIPTADWLPDLYDKLTTRLQESVLPQLDDYATHQDLAAQCTRIDQGLKRIADRKERYQRSARSTTAITTREASTPPRSTQTPASTSNARPLTLPAATRNRPHYDDPRRKELSRIGACFECGQPGHMVRDCPLKARPADVKNMETDSQGSVTAEESGKEES
jgi:Zinc knuckle